MESPREVGRSLNSRSVLLAINPFVCGVPTDTAILEQILREDISYVLDHLETQVPYLSP